MVAIAPRGEPRVQERIETSSKRSVIRQALAPTCGHRWRGASGIETEEAHARPIARVEIGAHVERRGSRVQSSGLQIARPMSSSGRALAFISDMEAGSSAARVRGLIYVTDESPGIRRVARGTGFVYRRADGRPITDDAELRRIRSLAIPPAWTNVWICPRPDGHLQATGRDARGRKQYRYHPRWREVRDEANTTRMFAFGRGAAAHPRAAPMPTCGCPGCRARRCWPPWCGCWRRR